MPTATTWANFGSGVSPILADGLVILVRDELKGSRIVALDAVHVLVIDVPAVWCVTAVDDVRELAPHDAAGIVVPPRDRTAELRLSEVDLVLPERASRKLRKSFWRLV